MSQWLRSNKARRLFFCSSWIVLCLGLFIIFMLTPWFQQIEATHGGKLLLQALGGALGVAGAPASLIIWFGMVAFCIREDRSPRRVKVRWFLLFFTASIFAAAIYFFKVYRKACFQQASTLAQELR